MSICIIKENVNFCIFSPSEKIWGGAQFYIEWLCKYTKCSEINIIVLDGLSSLWLAPVVKILGIQAVLLWHIPLQKKIRWRSYGYVPIGKSCIDRYNWQAKKGTNVIGDLYWKMLFALEYFEQNINRSIFYSWCKHTLIPSIKTKCVIVMDNARFYKRKCIQKLLNRPDHRILWLPLYRSELNPIEKKWAQAKFLRQGWMENNVPKLLHNIGCISFIVDWL